MSVRERLVAYKHLAKFDMFDVFLTIPLAWTLVGFDAMLEPRTIAILVLSLIGVVGIRTAESALDDVAGLREGIDLANYMANPSVHRPKKRKPLIEGRLTEAQALRYAKLAVATGVVCAVAAFAVAGFEPSWVPFAAAFAAALVVSYSWGPKLSYIGGQELVVFLGVSFTLSMVYAVITHDLTWMVVSEGLVLGIWLSQPMIFANLPDIDADRQAGRITMAVRLEERAYRRFTAVFFALGWVVFAIALATGALPWWAAFAQLPALGVQVFAIRAWLRRHDPLLARHSCHYAYRAGLLGLAVTNLIVVN
jgi:1,4-dihydroxy-2-naphthoate octaprenyltransferase